MQKLKMVALIAVTMSPLAMAKVTGERAEVFGTGWQKMELQHWISEKNALLNPEVTNLAVQSCLRDSQKQIDVNAYKIASRLVQELDVAFRDSREPYAKQLLTLSTFLKAVDAIQVEGRRPTAAQYTAKCEATVTEALRQQATRDTLESLYTGRMHPKVLEALARKGVKLAPLTWDGLKESVCKLEGYYSTSDRQELWKFFSITRAMANVLPSEAESAKFVQTLATAPQASRLIAQLNVYSSVAGKYNGASIGMTEVELKSATERLTGPALGSKAPALMAFFTTAWREQLQKIVMDRPYPEKPFQLLTSGEILQSVKATFEDRAKGAQKSQTERGMSLVWKQYAPFVDKNDEADVYGEVTADYRQAYALAWVALNAETNVRANEKLAGMVATSAPPPPTQLAFGSPEAYGDIAKQLDLAIAAYKAVDTEVAAPFCVRNAQKFLAAAGKVKDGEVAKLAREDVDFWRSIKVPAVIADIGGEVYDDEDGAFRLHLAVGRGHEVKATIADREYSLYTPSAMVLHLPKVTSTAEWQNGLVDKYDVR